MSGDAYDYIGKLITWVAKEYISGKMEIYIVEMEK